MFDVEGPVKGSVFKPGSLSNKLVEGKQIAFVGWDDDRRDRADAEADLRVVEIPGRARNERSPRERTRTDRRSRAVPGN